jgi:hypothetical protein
MITTESYIPTNNVQSATAQDHVGNRMTLAHNSFESDYVKPYFPPSHVAAYFFVEETEYTFFEATRVWISEFGLETDTVQWLATSETYHGSQDNELTENGIYLKQHEFDAPVSLCFNKGRKSK